ncbi:Signal transduction histidine kinase [Solimonas aquatica]|uniref:histidine kinase n=1 Tax=Solimonas aquatica TaxID=489703 RepID=A0A1H9LU58_9GAMM|nr:ATP-binding protein [Solimonas aquatica]SER14715.1 Signal transduction histidine kinase [Solimonas aquatica]
MSARWWRWQDWSLGAKSAAAVAVPLASLLAALSFNYRLQQDLNAADAEVRRALAIQADIQTLHTQLAEAATGVRGYLLTGRDDFLTPYLRARDALPGTLAELRRNISDPQVMAHLESASALLERKQQSLEELRLQGRQLAPAELQAHLIRSKQVLDALRGEVRAMQSRETDLVAEYSDKARRALHRNFWMDIVSSILVLASGVGAFLLLYSGVVRRVQRLALNAERLAQGAPLAALPAGRDELGQLADRLHNASLLLAKRAAEAQSANQAKTQFLSRISHELRTPLNAILGFAQLLESDLQGSAQAPQVEQILLAGRHLLALIDEVLDIARIESGSLKLKLEAQPLQPLIQEACDLVAPLATRHRIRLQHSGEHENLAALADRQRLLQVLINLLSNAIKYNRPQGEVRISLQESEGKVRIAVQDSGVGIPAAQIPRLFTPFDRLGAESGTVEGTGLGLAVSRQLMLHMGGDIEVSSKPGQGSVFVLRLDMAQAQVNETAAPALAPAAGLTLSQPRAMQYVLVIEDNASNLALLQAVIARRAGWHLVAARDGAEGLRQARALRPALILLDLHLPLMSGEAVLAELRGDPSFAQTPIVIISADALPATIERLRAAGASDYLTKPLAVSRVLTLLDRSGA